jgi:putative transposase
MADRFKGRFRTDSNRYKFWDYSSPGNYFLTMNIKNSICILGEVLNGEMILSDFGEIVKSEILMIPEYHERASLNEWVVMPNHVHMIISLSDYTQEDPKVAPEWPVERIHEFSLQEPLGLHNQQGRMEPLNTKEPLGLHNQQGRMEPLNTNEPLGRHNDQDGIGTSEYKKQRRKMIIPKMMGKFQMLTSKRINQKRRTPGRKNWQYNYHDHVIRTSKSYYFISNYINTNPENWKSDLFYQ